MKRAFSSSVWVTVGVALVVTAFSLLAEVKDFGNVDFYRRPLTVVWLLVTLLSVVLASRYRAFAFIGHAWWLQILMPVFLFCVSTALVSVYQPYMRHSPKPNQALEPTTMLVTPRAFARVAPSTVVAHL